MSSIPSINLGRTINTEERLVGRAAEFQDNLLSGRRVSLGDFARTQAGIGTSRTFIDHWVNETKSFMKMLKDLMSIGTSRN